MCLQAPWEQATGKNNDSRQRAKRYPKVDDSIALDENDTLKPCTKQQTIEFHIKRYDFEGVGSGTWARCPVPVTLHETFREFIV